MVPNTAHSKHAGQSTELTGKLAIHEQCYCLNKQTSHSDLKILACLSGNRFGQMNIDASKGIYFSRVAY